MKELLKKLGIRESDKYLESFRGAAFVIKCGGSLLENASTGGLILDDLAFLKREGVRPVLVHGGGVQADKDMETAGIKPRRHKGLRITCDKTIKILDACFGNLNRELVDRLRKREIEAIGFSGANGGLIQGEKMTLDGVDLGWVGNVTGIDRQAWDGIGENELPVISSLGISKKGETLNINADYVGTQLALLTGARKLILMTDVDGVMTDPGDPSSLMSTLTVDKARELISNGTIAGGMIPKIESAVRAIKRGLPSVHLINGNVPHALLLEVLTRGGVGTWIVKE